MGRMSLPSISKLEDVLDLLLDPAKYQKYLVEFKEIHDEVKLSLGILQTKEQADLYFRETLEAKQAAYADVKLAAEVLADAQTNARNMMATAQEFSDMEHAKYAQLQSDIDRQIHDLITAQSVFDTTKRTTEAQLFDEQEEQNKQRTKLDKLHADLSVKQAKIHAASAALA